MLTTNEWTLLSNMVRSYEASGIASQAHEILQQQISLPPRLRSKSSGIISIIRFIYSTLQPSVEQSAYFQHLPIVARQTLVHHNLEAWGRLNCIFTLREINAFAHEAFTIGCNTTYGDETVRTSAQFMARLESNGALVKAMLMIFAFSSNCSIVTAPSSESLLMMTSSIVLVRVQHVFVTVLWKYLIYLYGLTGAVRWFDSSIRWMLDLMRVTIEQAPVEYTRMIDMIVEETTRSLASCDLDLNDAVIHSTVDHD